MIEHIKGDLIKSFKQREINILGHCVNCQGVMGSGVAVQIKSEFPEVFDKYRELVNRVKHLEEPTDFLLGKAQAVHLDVVDTSTIYNLFGQNFYGRDKRYINYGAIAQAFSSMAQEVETFETIGFPYKICSDRAGGDWNIILEMIEFYFRNNHVILYERPE